MTLGEIKCNPENTVFMIRDLADAKIAISKINNPSFIKEASDIDRSLIGTMVSELCTNIVKYAGRGSVRMSKLESEEALDIEIWAEDEGPGIPNLDLAMKDHFTTGNTLGLGLPGLKRMADDFSIRSQKERGTIVYVRKRIKGRKEAIQIVPFAKSLSKEEMTMNADLLWDVGSCNRPLSGELVSGDLAFTVEFDSYLLTVMVDVSGHGLDAYKLGVIIQSYITENVSKDIVGLMKGLHSSLIGTLGAAVGLFLINSETETFQYASVGNTNAKRCLGGGWRGLSRDGVLGHRLPSIYLQDGMLKNGDIFLFWTDGLSEDLDVGFIKNHVYESAKKIAHQIVLECGKDHDDASCIVLKWLA